MYTQAYFEPVSETARLRRISSKVLNFCGSYATEFAPVEIQLVRFHYLNVFDLLAGRHSRAKSFFPLLIVSPAISEHTFLV